MGRALANDGSLALRVVARLADAALIAIVVVGLSSVAIGRVLPLVGHPVYVVAGPSMEPAIGIGSAVILDRVPSTELAVGDVVSLRSGTGRAIFTHRIIRLADRDDARWLETQGDANDAPDPSITPASAVIGRVGLSIPYAGYLVALLSTVPGVVLVISTGALLLCLAWWLESILVERRLATAVRPDVSASMPEGAPSAPAWAAKAPTRGTARPVTAPGDRADARSASIRATRRPRRPHPIAARGAGS